MTKVKESKKEENVSPPVKKEEEDSLDNYTWLLDLKIPEEDMISIDFVLP